MRKLLLAFGFLTVVPVPVGGSVREDELAGAMAWFPLVGLFLGAAAAALYAVTGLVSDSLVRDFLPLAFLVLVTGNLHGDGLMDSADGLLSGRPIDRTLEIMKDSRVGSHGVTAGFLSLLAKIVFLRALAPGPALTALVLAPVIGRWSQVHAAANCPYVRPRGTGVFTTHLGRREVITASALTLAASLVTLGWSGIVLVGSAFLGTNAAERYLKKKLGGVTGDTLGALNECVEILVFAVILALGRFQ